MQRNEVRFETAKNTIGTMNVSVLPRIGEHVVLGYRQYKVIDIVHKCEEPSQSIVIRVELL